MNKKKLFLGLLLLFAFLSSACGNQSSLPEATLSPDITNPAGGVFLTDKKAVEGRVTKINDKEIVLKVQGVEWKLALTEHTKWEAERFAELDKPILKGSMMLVYYEETEDGVMQATKLEHLRAN